MSYGDFSLVFETVYYVLNADYNLHMDIQQAINFRIHERFEQEGIEFAYPTQTVVIRQGARKRIRFVQARTPYPSGPGTGPGQLRICISRCGKGISIPCSRNAWSTAKLTSLITSRRLSILRI